MASERDRLIEALKLAEAGANYDLRYIDKHVSIADISEYESRTFEAIAGLLRAVLAREKERKEDGE